MLVYICHFPSGQLKPCHFSDNFCGKMCLKWNKLWRISADEDISDGEEETLGG